MNNFSRGNNPSRTNFGKSDTIINLRISNELKKELKTVLSKLRLTTTEFLVSKIYEVVNENK
jgi:antitoxin component of RelBE/YafQ-DinJ toxin-antitoxin module